MIKIGKLNSETDRGGNVQVQTKTPMNQGLHGGVYKSGSDLIAMLGNSSASAKAMPYALDTAVLGPGTGDHQAGYKGALDNQVENEDSMDEEDRLEKQRQIRRKDVYKSPFYSSVPNEIKSAISSLSGGSSHGSVPGSSKTPALGGLPSTKRGNSSKVASGKEQAVPARKEGGTSTKKGVTGTGGSRNERYSALFGTVGNTNTKSAETLRKLQEADAIVAHEAMKGLANLDSRLPKIYRGKHFEHQSLQIY